MDESGRAALGASGSAVWALLVLACLFALLSASGHASAQCIDEPAGDEPEAHRAQREVQKRVFQKAGRHELSVMAGLYAADLLSSSYLLQAAYSYHVAEDLGLEASFGYSRAESDLVRVFAQDASFTVPRVKRAVYIYEGHLLWSLAYGKLRWFSGSISRFDLYTALGGGVTDSQTVQGLTISAGLGMKLLFNRWFGARFDVRDQILSQELLGISQVVNNLAATLGVSVFMPLPP